VGILDLLVELHAEHQTTLVLVTHSPEVAARAERVITLHDGRLVGDQVSSGGPIPELKLAVAAR